MGEMIKRQVIAKGRYLLLARRGNWEYVERLHARGVVVIAATTDQQELILIEQFRIPLLANVIELPAGLVGDSKEHADEDIIDAAKRELLEETGYEAKHFSPIISGPSSAGLSNEIYTMLHAHGLNKIGAGGGVHDERIAVHCIGLKNVQNWLQQKIAEGKLIDPKILAALFYLLNRGS